ncbi:hypothetical protein [Listeria ivanovii]|uniref:hypothetical protein n=1 Tax=Listeria ivanovii TaxID=1638 RepID=UPI001940AD7C|nr:hypothetical protein [Listeria ivanovii]MBM5705169.1 hypothetical protein [Listeria ivanovii]HAM2151977.1 hypothetical protein [Listeria monocytogenes]
MGRPVKNKARQVNFLYGTWTLEEFAQASPRSYGWWLDNIKDYPELAEFSNWSTKNQREPWVFDATKANEWILNHFVYKKV